MAVHMVWLLFFLIQDIGSLLLHLADAVDELSKQSPSSDTVEHKTKDFLKSLEVSVYRTGVPYIPIILLYMH